MIGQFYRRRSVRIESFVAVEVLGKKSFVAVSECIESKVQLLISDFILLYSKKNKKSTPLKKNNSNIFIGLSTEKKHNSTHSRVKLFVQKCIWPVKNEIKM